jgi:hypothetical protein
MPCVYHVGFQAWSSPTGIIMIDWIGSAIFCQCGFPGMLKYKGEYHYWVLVNVRNWLCHPLKMQASMHDNIQLLL